MTNAIILITTDATLLPVLQHQLNDLEYRPIVATDEARLTQSLFQSPLLVMIDLASDSFAWAGLVHLVRKSKAGPVPIVGFGVDEDSETGQNALLAGCTAVVKREAVTNQLAQVVARYKWVMDKSRCQDSPLPLLLEGIALFNRREFFECHEVIELAWNEEAAPVRIMYQGILQIGVACYHIQNKNWRGAMKLFERGMPKLRRFTPVCMGIDLAQLLLDAETNRQELLRLGPEWTGEFDEGLFPVIQIK